MIRSRPSNWYRNSEILYSVLATSVCLHSTSICLIVRWIPQVMHFVCSSLFIFSRVCSELLYYRMIENKQIYIKTVLIKYYFDNC